MWKVQLFKLNYDGQESQAVKDVVDGGWITMGEKTIGFELKFSAMLGNGAKSVAVSNGTAALHIALLALGVKAGDEVIIPALTFVADINVVRLVGATPVLADCGSYDNWNMSAESIRKQITDKTKAIMIVHYAGYPCEMDEITALCRENNLYLIEDAAHAPGATYKGQRCGTFGDFGCFSFFTNKNLSVGEGGMIVTKDAGLEQQARYLRSHGMTALTLDRHKGRAISYDVVQSGLNYRVDEMRAALGIVQLEKLPAANAQRKVLVERYIGKLKGIAGFSLPFLDMENVEPVYHIFPILLNSDVDRVGLIGKLKDFGIQTSIHYPTFDTFTAFKDIDLNEAPVAQDIAKRELTLPLYPTMSFEEVDVVVDCLEKALSELRT